MKLIILSVVLVCFSQVSFADIDLLTPSEIKALIGNFPKVHSAEELKDDETLLNFQKNRTKEQCSNADAQSDISFKKMFLEPNGPLTKDEFKDINAKMLKVSAKIGINIQLAKTIYKRPRPYLRNPKIIPCIALEKSYSYPSGHATISRVWGRVLSELYPDRREEFMTKADEVALNRVLGGVHHPSDIVAGKKLGDVLAVEVLDDLIDD
jgi:acid phosphatase (class A)